VLLVWVITNAGLVAGILQPSNTIITENGQKVLNTSSVSITYMGVML
jgi:hypothetical protein